ncbi:nucleotidyltransferase [Corallococcus sp. Z5C101001]|uniref:nucleotidyltransferase domain-containing protein n=1 Tax=Corallococcus sp. Z5C101001 TaxID=2596829 RepID=UPI00117F94D1|nr:nucleotidyltransferase [Corallococcus sp. Z5C101001]TSC33932.1 nucleotidyltransferase [Corallococcus sp. Z5C101001]
MAVIQAQLIQFDNNIRLTRFSENRELREKRDIILDKLRDRFAALRKSRGKEIPYFESINQGSYEMGTGIHPAKGDYDIDVGLKFNRATSKYPNPVDLKRLVADALDGHTELGTEIRRSCVTVSYKRDGEQAFHVDLAVYAYEDPDSDPKKLFIAKGKKDAEAKDRWWEESDPEGLTDWVATRFEVSEQQVQFLRVIRALKRWKSEKFKMDGQNAPSGIGLTVAAGQWFRPQVREDSFMGVTATDDLKAMQDFIAVMVNRFIPCGLSEKGAPRYRLHVLLPVAPRKDIFERMSDGQMTTFRDRLIQLQERLTHVVKETDPVEACKLMQKEFGEEFPVPDKGGTGRPGGRSIISSGVAAAS